MREIAIAIVFAVLAVSLCWCVVDRICTHRERMKILENHGEPTWISWTPTVALLMKQKGDLETQLALGHRRK